MDKALNKSLRIAATGPDGVHVVNVMRFLVNPVGYVLDRLAPYADLPVVPLTGGNSSLVMLRGEEAAKSFYTDIDAFHRVKEGTMRLPCGHAWSGMFDGVLTANGTDHCRRRKVLAPAFQRDLMHHYQGIFSETFKRSKFALSDCGTFDLVQEFRSMTRANMLIGLMGLEACEQSSALAASITDALDVMFNPMILMLRFNHRWTPYGRWVGRISRTYDTLCHLIEQRRREQPRMDALSILCHATDEDGKLLAASEIAGELHGLILAGYETSASALTWAMLTCLSRADIPGDLTAVMNETQRVLPTIPITLPRRAASDVEVAGRVTIPRGAIAFMSPLLEHRNPEVFSAPDEFRPERWNGVRPSPYVFVPFGIGPRRCLGVRFAETQVRTTLTHVFESGQWEALTRRVDYTTRSGIMSFPRRPVLIRRGSRNRLPQLSGSVTRLWRQTD